MDREGEGELFELVTRYQTFIFGLGFHRESQSLDDVTKCEIYFHWIKTILHDQTSY